MDIKGDPDVASACKRQKRNNSSDESCNDDDSEEAGTSKATGTDEAAADIRRPVWSLQVVRHLLLSKFAAIGEYGFGLTDFMYQFSVCPW